MTPLMKIFQYGQVGFCLWAITACTSSQPPVTLGSTTPVLDTHYGQSLKTGKEQQRIPSRTSDAQVSIESRELKQTYDGYVQGKASTSRPALEPIIDTDK